MRQFTTFIILMTACFNSFSQKYDHQTICFSDTLTVQGTLNIKGKGDTTYSYRAIKCEKRANGGLRIEFGISKYYYNTSTEKWLGNHGGPNFNFILTIDKFNIGIRFKPWTVEPKSELIFSNDTLTKLAKLNPVKLDYYLGYSIDFSHNISIEPYLGYSRTTFVVINEDELKKTFSIPKAGGLTTGGILNKYFRIKDYEYISAFAILGYSLVDYQKTHQNLGAGYLEWTLGIAYKGFFKKTFLKKIE